MNITLLTHYLKTLLDVDIPQQFVLLTGLKIAKKLCKEFKLPTPTVLAGNIIVGNLEKADMVLTAHLDELTFGFISQDEAGGYLAPYHKYALRNNEQYLTIIGVRNNSAVKIGNGILTHKNNKPYCRTSAPIKPGDRCVYYEETKIQSNLVTGKAIDNRVGVLIALLAMKQLEKENYSVAIVLTDGEEQIPDGYFGRNFPHVLGFLKETCKICFIDGIYRDGLEPVGYTKPPQEALIIPHSSYGKGYIVPPMLFAKIRDDIIPKARNNNIKVSICNAYRSRGDEWGLVMNPVQGVEFNSFFVDFGAWGDHGHEVPLSVDVRSITNCVKFIVMVSFL